MESSTQTFGPQGCAVNRQRVGADIAGTPGACKRGVHAQQVCALMLKLDTW